MHIYCYIKKIQTLDKKSIDIDNSQYYNNIILNELNIRGAVKTTLMRRLK